MEIVLNRIVIKEFTKNLVEPFALYHNDLEWMMYQGFKDKTEAEFEEELLSNKTIFDGKQLAIVDKKSGLLVGDLYLLIEEDSTAWVGYTISPKYSNLGLMKEALNGLFKELSKKNVTKVFAEVLIENESSISLLKTLDFKLVEENEEDYIFCLELKND